MTTPTRALAAIIASASLFALAGCSVDVALWRQDGANVIGTTEEFIDAAASDEQDSFACEGFAADFGDPGAWEGLSAGEPESLEGTPSVDRSTLDASWRINLEGLGSGTGSGDAVPTDVFYRDSADGLCIADIIWQTVDT